MKLLPRLRMRRSGVPAARWRTAVRLAAVAALAGGILTTVVAPAQALPLEQHHPATYNMQGGQGGDVTPKWSTDIPALLANHDILALQEAGPVPPQNQNGPFVYQDSTSYTDPATGKTYTVYHYIRNFGTSSRTVLRHVYFMETDPNGHRVNLAMVSTALPDRVWITPEAITNVSRPSFGLQFGATVFNDIHALSGNGQGPDAPGLLQRIAARQGAFGDDWAVLGDFNQHPNTLTARGLPANSYLYRPGATTQLSGGELDYMVSSRPVLLYEGHVMTGISSDHWPVEFAVAPLQAAAGYSIGSYSNYSDQERVADIRGGSSSNGTPLVVYDNLGGGNQHFNLVPTANGTGYFIRNQSTGKCLDLAGGTRAGAGSYVNEWDCQGQITQRWYLQSWPGDPGAVEISNSSTGMCLDVLGAFPFNDTPIDIWPCVGSPNQKWTLEYLGLTLETA